MKKSLGHCYCCATPIGNLSDVTQRLLDTLKHVSLIAAEDTRNTQLLCKRHAINTPMIRLDAHSEKNQLNTLLSHLKNGEDLAIVSDAGTPTISDPGAYTIQALQEHNITCVPIPGPSAVTTLLSVSGLNADQYTFAGFFPRTSSQAKTRCKQLETLNHPIVFFESPKRLLNTLTWLSENHPDSYCICGKELSKTYETILKGSPKDILNYCETLLIKGEWTFAIQFKEKAPQINTTFLAECQKQNLDKKTILALSKSLGWKKNQVYETLINP